mgnify:CR=1 FL=1
MKALNIVGGSIVLFCVVVVSYSHTLALFGMGGFTGIFQHMAVIAIEVTFLLGALNLVVSRMRGVSPGVPATIGGIFGIAVVGWGNVEAGIDYGLHGIILGAAIPVSLIIAESILSRAILQQLEAAREAKQAENHEISQDSESPNVAQESPKEQEESPKEKPTITQDSPSDTQESPTVAQESQESPKDHPEVTQDGELSPSDSPSLWEDVQKTAQMIEESPNHSPTVAQIIEEPPKESPSTDDNTQEDTQHTQESPKIETDPAVIYQIAWEMYEKNGEPPTRRGLAEAANTTEHRARKAIDRLKAELEQMQREVVAS